MPIFGTLERVAIREGWPSEPSNFTPWLADPENMALLSSEIGLDLEATTTEFQVGEFSLDILARIRSSGEAVVIENQFGSTDHTHLGQLLTYAAGVGTDGGGARTIIWIAENSRDRHRAVIDWLNRTTEPEIRFFAVQLELWRIGSSPLAPKFNVVAKPNEWQKQLTQNSSEPSDSEKSYVDFWNGFFGLCKETNSSLQFRNVPRRTWWLPTTPAGSGCGINLNATQKSGNVECHVWIEGSKAKEKYEWLKAQERSLSEKLGADLFFDDMPGRAAFKIYKKTNKYLRNRGDWPSTYTWLKETGEAFHLVFDPLWSELLKI